MIDEKALLAHLTRVILNEMSVFSDPFPYFVAENLFPTDYYAQMMALWPDRGRFQRIGGMARSIYEGAQAPRDQSAAFWSHFQEFTSHHVKTLLHQRLSSFYPRRYVDLFPGREAECVAKQSLVFDSDRGDALFEDGAGAEIGVHVDQPSVVLRALMYLPTDESLKHLGTALYKPVFDRFFMPLSAVLPPKFNAALYREATRFPYVPNVMGGWVNTPKSMHAFQEGTAMQDDAIRRGYFLTVFLDKPSAREIYGEDVVAANYFPPDARPLVY